MSDSGILQAAVTLDDGVRPLHLSTRRFYAPQAGQVSFSGALGAQFASSILKQAEEEWGDLAAASGPEGGPEVKQVQNRIEDQREMLTDAAGAEGGADNGDPEAVRRVAEEARFIRQDVARIGKKHRGAMLQRRLGKQAAVFNRIARAHADKAEIARFDNHAAKLQTIIEQDKEAGYDDGDVHLSEMRDLFFSIAWRNKDYVTTWYQRLKAEPFLFPDAQEYTDLTREGDELLALDDRDKMKDLVTRMLSARVSLGASDTTTELATIVKA